LVPLPGGVKLMWFPSWRGNSYVVPLPGGARGGLGKRKKQKGKVKSVIHVVPLPALLCRSGYAKAREGPGVG